MINMKYYGWNKLVDECGRAGNFRAVCAVWLAFWAGIAAITNVSAAPQLLSPTRDSAGAFSVSIGRLAGTNYTLEASINLQTWYVVTNGATTGGEVRVTDPAHVPARRIYYRAHDGPPNFIQVVPQIDTNTVATLLVTPDFGGSCQLTNKDGVIFTFTVSSNQVAAPVPVQMQLIANYSSFPKHSGLNVAVAFSPDGFEFNGGGLLEIQFPTAVPVRTLTSYSMAGDGRGFHFVPDRLTTNRVSIPVTHFSGLGVAGWAADERAAVLDQSIQSQRDATSMEIEIGLRKIRDREDYDPEKDAADESAVIAAALDDFYHTALEPFLADAAGDCSVFRTLVPSLAAWERQRELLGVAKEGETPAWANLYQDAFCNCVSEAFAKCDAGALDTQDTMTSLLGMERQSQLMGMDGISNCSESGGGDVLSTVSQIKCTSAWNGYLNYSSTAIRNYSTNYTDSSGNKNTVNKTVSYQFSFQAVVTDSSILENNPFLNSVRWRLTLKGNGACVYKDSSVSVSTGECVEQTTENHTSCTGNNPVTFKLEFVIEKGLITEFTCGTFDFKISGPQTYTDKIENICDGGGSTSEEDFNTDYYVGPVIPDYPVESSEINFTQQSFQTLAGSTSVPNRSGGLGDATVTSKSTFSFIRKPN